MAFTSGFFNSVSGDRKYNADDMTRYFEGLISSGVFANPSNNLRVTSTGDDMVVSVQPGRGIIDCRWFNNDAAYDFTLDAADALLDRKDAIVMRYNINSREIVLAVKTGTPATYPSAPTMLRTADTMEYCLAQVRVNKGVTQISQANITDTRADKDLCGWITNLVDNIDLTEFYRQWQNAFELEFLRFKAYLEQTKSDFDAWYAQLTETLSVPTVVKKYESSFTNEFGTSSIPINIPEYESGDALLVHLGGVLLREGTDYTVSGTNIVFPSDVPEGRTYTVIVFKPSIE